MSGKAKTSMCNWLNRLAATALVILATKKAKTPKDVFDKKLLLPIYLQLLPALRFLQAEKQKQVFATGLTYLQLLPLHYNFYKWKSKSWSRYEIKKAYL